MSEKLLYWGSTFTGLAALLLLIADISLISGNRVLQSKINDQQATIQRGVGLGQINQTLVQLLADASIKDNDADIRNLLADQGITIKATKTADDTKDTKKK